MSNDKPTDGFPSLQAALIIRRDGSYTMQDLTSTPPACLFIDNDVFYYHGVNDGMAQYSEYRPEELREEGRGVVND